MIGWIFSGRYLQFGKIREQRNNNRSHLNRFVNSCTHSLLIIEVWEVAHVQRPDNAPDMVARRLIYACERTVPPAWTVVELHRVVLKSPDGNELGRWVVHAQSLLQKITRKGKVEERLWRRRRHFRLQRRQYMRLGREISIATCNSSYYDCR